MSAPREAGSAGGGAEPIVAVRDLVKRFRGRGSDTVAVDGISFELPAGGSLGIVGESGSGKTTTARILCGLEQATAGSVRVAGLELRPGEQPPRDFYGRVQMIFQDPYLSLSPRMPIGEAVGYQLRVQGVGRAERRERVREAIAHVGLPVGVADRYPHELSTGQRQRIGIARAIIARPRLVLADEPVSSLDVSLQTQILNLLVRIQEETGVSYVFISHDLAVVGYLCDRTIVMKDGEILEQGDTGDVLERPRTDYTRKLMDAAGFGALDERGKH